MKCVILGGYSHSMTHVRYSSLLIKLTQFDWCLASRKKLLLLKKGVDMSFSSLLSGLIKPVIDGIFRWKEGEDKMEISRQEFVLIKKKLEADIELRVAEEMRKPDSEFRQFMLDYEGKASELPRSIQILRSSVRPVITYWSLVLITVLIFSTGAGENIRENLSQAPEQLWWIFLAIFGFWFGGRAGTQIMETMKKGEFQKTQVEARAQVESSKQQAIAESSRAKAEKERRRQEEVRIVTGPLSSTPSLAKVSQISSGQSRISHFPWDDQNW